MATDCSAELHSNEDAFAVGNTDGAFVQKEAGGIVGAHHTNKIPVFVVDVFRVLVAVAPGQGDEAIGCQLYLLRSRTFVIKMLKKVLKIMSDYSHICKKDA